MIRPEKFWPLQLRYVLASLLILTAGSGCAMFNGTSMLTSVGTDFASSFPQEEGAAEPDDEPGTMEFDSSPAITPASVDDDPGDQLASLWDVPTETPAPAARLLNPEFGPPTVSPIATHSGGHSVTTTGSVGHARVSGPARLPVVTTSGPVTASVLPSSQVRSVSESHSVAASEGEVPLPRSARHDPSVLDRLRGITETDPDQGPAAYLRRQLDRIPNPLELFQGESRDSVSGTENGPAGPVGPVAVIETDGESLIPAAEQELLVQLIEAWKQQLEAWPRTDTGLPVDADEYRRRQMDLALAWLMANEPAKATRAISSLGREEQEFWQEMVLGISRFRSPQAGQDAEQQIAHTLGQMRSALRHLEPVASVNIRRLMFCERIHGYGAVDAFRLNSFQPGQQLLIYAEVDNLQSEITEFGTYRTRFSGELQIWTAAGSEPLEKWTIHPTEDETTSRRRDFYGNYKITLPVHLTPDNYEMRVLVRDELTGRVTQEAIEFSVQ